ncbi:metallophosphoesterase [alpha proteobacterium AAP81b]|nr:metallophosphoesterase [alpha proteobacterium AAP81b]
MSLIFHISDVHFGTEDGRALAWFAGEVAAHKPDLVLMTGDVTAAARKSEFAAAGDWFESLAAPVRIEPGNHDLPVFHPLLRLLRPYDRLRRLIARFDRPAVLADVAIASLKTTARVQFRANWSLGHIGRGSVERTLAELAAAPAGVVKLVAAHHPLVDVGTRTPGSTKGGLGALTRLAGVGAAAVLTGHTHDPFDIEWEVAGRPIRLIGAGTLSMRVRESPASYNRLEIAGQALACTAVKMAV